MTTYLLLLSLHFVSITLWLVGMFILGVAMNAWEKIPPGESSSALSVFAALQRWNRGVTTPAMILSWLSGLALLLMGNWPPSGSLLVKMLFVLALSALHGLQSGSFRRSLAASSLTAPPFLRHANRMTLTAFIIIVLLIELKPL
ncbi:CopD family protein [Martelella alba]|uniref:Protoporphyrinogen IX oxidase n=1 Tax=Martelella alba TaxID=2590451 RepID=A0ABY2SJG0_9HYPH|nr:CopD family protein [Martelella alba]TKI05111.1 hypothetical protein FCN80_15530 [Martelella alba]